MQVPPATIQAGRVGQIGLGGGLLGGIRRTPAGAANLPNMPYLMPTQQGQATGRQPMQIACGTGSSILPQLDAGETLTKKNREQIIMETNRKQAQLPPLIISKSVISLFSWQEMQDIAPVLVTNLELSGSGSVNDPRTGVVGLDTACQCCSQIDCPGHYAKIQFDGQIYNPAFIREAVAILICVCNDCGGLLIDEDIIKQMGFNRLSYDTRLAAMEDYCKKDIVCTRKKPVTAGGTVRDCRKNPVYITTNIREKGEITFKVPKQGAKKVSDDDVVHIMPIKQVADIFNAISDADARLLGFPAGSHPRNIIMHGILVPPIIARPPVYDGGATHHDQLTHMFIAIARKVNEHNKSGSPVSLNELYTAVKQLIFKTEGKKMGMRDFLSIVERIQGKTALLRGLLMGKRNNHCGRTVAGPDPSLRFGQLRIPKDWAPVLTKKVTVTSFNIDYLTELKDKGRITHITSGKTGLRRFHGQNPTFKYKLQIGDIVERWLQNGDRIVNNRQPTLHRQSMMAYEVVLGHQLTIGLHLSYTSPMNCDFDGDENNTWNPQDFEVEAEVDNIMNVKLNIMSAEQNRPIMGLVMNSITGAYLLSDNKTRIDDDLFAELLSFITDREGSHTSLYYRLTKYGVHPRSGQAIFSAMLPSDFYYNHKNVLIMEGILLPGRVEKQSNGRLKQVTGRLTKAHVGASHRSIIQALWKKYGSERTADFFSDAPWVINKWIIERGFSVGLRDCVNLAIDPNTGEEYDQNLRVLDQELAKIYVQIEALGGKLDDAVEENYRQMQIKSLVDVAGNIGTRLADKVLKGDENSISVMTEKGAGTKGSVVNIGQMMGSVGQQFYRGKRLPAKLTGGTRLLPTYDMNDNNPEAHAFIPQSFFTGLTPQGLFFLQAGGRENLLDTALKTAETGAMQHRMIKAFENVIIGYDGSIRNTIGTMFTPMYNAGYDIAEMIAVDDPSRADLSSFIDITSTIAELNVARGWVPSKISKEIANQKLELQKENYEENVLHVQPNHVIQPLVTDTTINYDINQPVVPNPAKLSITKFEKARIIGVRATQLSNDATPFVDVDQTDPKSIDPVNIATREYLEGHLSDMYVVRKFADGSFEKVHATLDNI